MKLSHVRIKYLEHRWEITLMLFISSVFACLLEFIRIYLSHHHNYFYFIWNLFLSWIPYGISMYLPVSFVVMKRKWFAWLLLIIWFLFWPNAPYMLTDLLHLRQKQNIPLWFDLGLILSFAWTGLITGFISLIEIQNLIRKQTNRFVAWAFAVFMIFSGGLGIYIGRYIRVNSWDVVANPLRVLFHIVKHFNDQMMRIEMIGMTLMYSIFLLLGYLTIKVIIKIPDRMAL
jgi:uncharacterized membrane protein